MIQNLVRIASFLANLKPGFANSHMLPAFQRHIEADEYHRYDPTLGAKMMTLYIDYMM